MKIQISLTLDKLFMMGKPGLRSFSLRISPKNFSHIFHTQQGTVPAKIEIYLDASNPTMSAAIIKAVTQSIQMTLKEITTDLNKTQVEIPIAIDQTYAYGGSDTRFIDYFAPGVISFAIMMVTTMITIILFVNERRNGTLQRSVGFPCK